MAWRIDFTSGRSESGFDHVHEAIDAFLKEYPAGDVVNCDGGRVLCWECEEDSLNDDGFLAIAEIVQE